MSDSATPWIAAHQAPLSSTISWSLLKSISIESVMQSNHLILCLPVSSCPQSFPVSESFPKNWSFASSGRSTGASASASVLPMNIQSWFPLGLTGLISLKSKGLSRVFSSSRVWKHQFFGTQTSLRSNFNICTWLLDKPWLDGKVMSLLFNMLSRLVIAFLPKSKRLLISWLQSVSTVILEPRKNKVCGCFHYFPVYLPWSDGTRCHDLRFLNDEL